MKKLIFLTMAIFAVITTSCSKDENDDFTKPENLSGTTWKCSELDWDEDLEYAKLVFTSTTIVEGWTKYVDEVEHKDWTGSFTISNDEISISFEGDSFIGIIDGETMTVTIDGETLIFTKQ